METKEKTHWKKNFNYDYMGAYSLPEGKDVIVTIKSTKKEMVTGANGKKEECFVVYFLDSEKPMILNRTNCRAIEKLYGSPFIEDWGGKKIQLYSATVKAFGDTTDALRVRDFKPNEETDNSDAIKALNECKTLNELQDIYKKLSKPMQGNKDVIQLKDKLKVTLK
jgi:hypothetical protein